jgi:hypothetical protein
LTEAVRCLDAARELEPELDYPYREWNEMLALLGEEEIDFEDDEDRQLMGYRRGWVREALGAGWSILLPGNVDGVWQEGAWEGGNEELTIRFQSFSKDGKDREAWTEESWRGMRVRGEELEFERDGLLGKACVFADEDDEGEFWQLDGRVARPGKLALLTVNYVLEEQREDAEKIWRSLWTRASDG